MACVFQLFMRLCASAPLREKIGRINVIADVPAVALRSDRSYVLQHN